MSTPYVDALLQFDAGKQSISKRFYIKALAAGGLNRRYVRSELFFSDDTALATRVEALQKARTPAKRHAAVLALLQHHPTAGIALLLTAQMAEDPNVALGCTLAIRELVADIVKRQPMVIHDPQLDHLLSVVGIEELFNALIDLKMYRVLVKAAEDQIKVMPHYAQWIYVTLLTRAAVRPYDGGPYQRIRKRFEEWIGDDQELHTLLLLADIANAVVSISPQPALTRMITEYNRIPRTPRMDDEIRSFAFDLPQLPTLLNTHDEPLTMDDCLHRVLTATDHHTQLHYADKGLAIAAQVQADATRSPFIDLLAGRARALFAMNEHDAALTTLEQLFMVQTEDQTEMYEPFIALLLAKGPHEFDRALMLIQDAREIGNYYPALPWLQLLAQLHRIAPPDTIIQTLNEGMKDMPWIGLMIAGYRSMESSRDPGPPTEIDQQLLAITFYIVHHAYSHYPRIIQQLRTLLH